MLTGGSGWQTLLNGHLLAVVDHRPSNRLTHQSQNRLGLHGTTPRGADNRLAGKKCAGAERDVGDARLVVARQAFDGPAGDTPLLGTERTQVKPDGAIGKV